MNFKNFTDKIEDFKNVELGGLDAQFKMAPKLRLQYNKDKIAANKPRKAAVLALFYPNKKNETTLLLTQRPSYKGIHSAQISFPGGKAEKTDGNLKETALRETFEEVGVQTSSIKIITIEILVSDLLNENNITTVNLTTSYMKNIDVPCFKIDDHIIWGATGMMLSEIKELLK